MSGDFTAFFYGTLMAPEVFFSVCYGNSNPPDAIKNLHTLTPCVLDGYCRHRVKSAPYPGIIQEDGHSVRGIYATGLTDANMLKLDYFEGSEYERKRVKVRLLSKEGDKDVEGEEKDANAYIFLFPELLERKEWDFQNFRKENMTLYASGDWENEQDPSDRAVVAGNE